jgi:hypothetical protein
MKITCKENKRNERIEKEHKENYTGSAKNNRPTSVPQGKHLEISLYQAFITG